jgi:molybdopterin/thiamine biosynthesis adenylyltransferase
LATWYEQCPERLEAELRALSQAGLSAEIDEAAKQTGQLALTVKRPIEGVLHDFRVVFPDAYPYFAFQVLAPSLSLARHQEPYSKQLCFIAHIETDWRSDDTVAHYLTERLDKILEANRSETAYEGEPREGAPVTGYLGFEPESVILIGDLSGASGRQHGKLRLRIDESIDSASPIRGVVLEASDEGGKAISTLDERFSRGYAKSVKARWVRLSAAPKSNNPGAILAEAVAAWPALKDCLFDGAPDVVGIVFKDEARYRELHDVWIFLIRRKQRQDRPNRGKRQADYDIRITLARADRLNLDNLQARVPRLRPLTTKKGAVFGVGALGSMVCWQLARAGIGKLALVDSDIVSAGGIVRWLLGLFAAGRSKTAMLASYIQSGYPLVEVEPILLRLGSLPLDWDAARQQLEKSLSGADIIIDCTAEFAVHHYLSTLARERNIPYVWATATPGGWGGRVGRASPDKTEGCWACFSRHCTDGTFPPPQSEDRPDVQPVGCFSPTFTGTGFDMDLVSIMAARLAVATLCRGSEGYPDFNWDVGVVDLWKDGMPIAPQWRTFSLHRHDQCDAHG